MQPGQWEIVTTIKSVDMPGAPPQVVQAMKSRPTRISSCLSAEDAARGPQEMMKTNKQCRFTHYLKQAGKIDSQMVCSQSGGTMTATTTGTFSPTGFTSNARMVLTGAQKMTMTATTVGKRVGACR